MGLIKLVINELIKIFKKKSTIIFLTLSIVSFFAAYGIIYMEKNSRSNYTYKDYSIEVMTAEVERLKTEAKTVTKEKQTDLNLKIETYEYAIKNNIQIYNNNKNYKVMLVLELFSEKEILSSIDKEVEKKEYINQKNKIDRIQKILDDNSFEDYITYNKEKIEKDYKDKLISQEEYNTKIEEQNLGLKYEIDKYPMESNYLSWKKEMLNINTQIDTSIKNRYDYVKKEYLSDDGIKKLEEQKMINTYRLENNMPTNYSVTNSVDSSNSFYRWSYDSFAISLSMFFITLLVIVLASSSISEETSKGTIKFLVISPFKRFKIILAKLISYVLILVVVTLILSQINVLLGNIFFSNAHNEYIHVINDKVEIMNTNLYETLQYLLKLPEIIIYILLGITLSTLFRNTAIANTFTVMIYIGAPIAIQIVQQFVKLDFLKYLPFTNFDLQSKILPIYNPTYSYVMNDSYKYTTLEFSIIVLSITAFLLLVTMFESFNKKDII